MTTDSRPMLMPKLTGSPADIPVVDVRQLLGDGREVILLHQGEPYRLRVTARDKLILTK